MAGRSGMTGIQCGDVQVFSVDESLDKIYETFIKVMKEASKRDGVEDDVDVEEEVVDELKEDSVEEKEKEVERLSPWDLAAKRMKEKIDLKSGSKA